MPQEAGRQSFNPCLTASLYEFISPHPDIKSALLCGALTCNIAAGVEVRWKGNNNNNWGNKDNWRVTDSANKVPDSGDTIRFTDISNTKRASVDLNGGRAVAGLRLDTNDFQYGTATEPWTLFGGRLINARQFNLGGQQFWSGSRRPRCAGTAGS